MATLVKGFSLIYIYVFFHDKFPLQAIVMGNRIQEYALQRSGIFSTMRLRKNVKCSCMEVVECIRTTLGRDKNARDIVYNNNCNLSMVTL